MKRTSMQTEAYTGLVSLVVILNGNYAYDPVDSKQAGFDRNMAYLWLRPFDESDEARAAWLKSVLDRLKWTGPVAVTRARP